MGFAGNLKPQFIIPTAMTAPSSSDDLNFETGLAAMASQQQQQQLVYPIRHGQVENWDWMEAYWQHCLFKYLRCDPEAHYFMLTEPPLNAPENRECTAEIMFETFNVPGLYIGVQAVLALAASWTAQQAANRNTSLTGTVIDSGDGVTHVIPVVDGYVIGSAVKHVPLAGRDVTHFIQQLLRERQEASLPPHLTMEVATLIKEQHCFVSPNLANEFAALDALNSLPVLDYRDPVSARTFSVQMAHERFLAAEAFFNPELVSSEHLTPLPNLVDSVIQACPVDARRGLYANVVLSGGSTLFKDFSKRLQRDLKGIVDERLSYVQGISSIVNKRTDPVDVHVCAHENQRHAVFTGGSLMAATEQFATQCHTKAEYDEIGPSVCRQSRVFSGLV
jgi:actin-related protein 3